MTNFKTVERELSLSNYILKYTIKEPSKASDYDYDPDRPYRRFVSTYLHKLDFYDKILNTNILSIHFSSDACANIISALYSFLYGEKALLLSIKNIYVKGSLYPKVMAIHRFNDQIQISILGTDISQTNIVFPIDKIDSIIELLQFDFAIDIFDRLNSEQLRKEYEQ